MMFQALGDAVSTIYMRFYYVTPDTDHWPKYIVSAKTYSLTAPDGISAEQFSGFEPMWMLTNEEQVSLSCSFVLRPGPETWREGYNSEL
jgi:hypothetical protein